MNKEGQHYNSGGLRSLPCDERDFKLGAFFNLPDIKELPETFSLGTGFIDDQEKNWHSDYCSAYATCGASELQEGVKLSRGYSFALSKLISGDLEEWGQDLRTAIKAHTQFGAIAEKDLIESELNLKDKAKDIRLYRVSLKDKAKGHIKDSYFNINGQYDSYDNIRASIWKFREKKQAVVLGVRWGWDISQYKLTGTSNGYGHALYAVGWTPDGIEVVNSYGLKAGLNGTHIIARDTINAYAEQFGAFMMVDNITPKEVKWALDYGIKENDNWLIKLYKILKTLILK